MKSSVLLVCFCFLLCVGFFVGYKNGEREKQQEIENRAKQINKECYTNQDIEIIVFGETQE